MFRIDYTVYEDDNNFMPAETYTYDQAVTKAAELLTDSKHVRAVTITRDDPATEQS